MLFDKVIRTIEEHDLIEKGQHIVLGLSGGPDSVCLFHVLMRLRERLDITVHPVHINHKLRPGEAERDQAYVEELCRRTGTGCRVFTVDCGAMAKELGMTGEEAGRIARYDAFRETAEDIASMLAENGAKGSCAKGCGAKKTGAKSRVRIAVAHNADDQAETILFRLLRGTGTDGLAGMAYRRDDAGFEIIRPLMDVSRKEIEEYCDAEKLEPVIDHTNNEAVYSRNRIRLELIPYLEDGYNGNIKETLVRLGRIASEDRDYIWSCVEKAYAEMAEKRYADACGGADHEAGDVAGREEQDASGKRAADAVVMDREKLAATHSAVRHRLVMRAFADIGLEKDISEERLKAADAIIGKKQAPKTVEFPRGYRLEVARGLVTFSRGRR